MATADAPFSEDPHAIQARVQASPALDDGHFRAAEHLAGDTVTVIPVVEERITVSKRLVEGERVRVRLVTDEIAELARVSLRSERIEVDRVSIGRVVATAPPVREEDGVTIIPVLEEVIVVEKRLVLKEELRVRRVVDIREEEQRVALRRQRAEVERLAPPTAESGQSGATPSNPGQTGS